MMLTNPRRIVLAALLSAFSVFALLAGARLGSAPRLTRGVSAAQAASLTANSEAASQAARVFANELGVIPIVMYHDIAPRRSPRDKAELVRTPQEFREDLELLYQGGFRPVNLGDLLNGQINLPAGFSPVVLTFDDARRSQFAYTKAVGSGGREIAPDCALGILRQFHTAHADWPLKATFFVLPHSSRTDDPFGEKNQGEAKLRYLVAQGMEIGNHTLLHRNMRHLSAAVIQQEIARAHQEILTAAPRAAITAVALPMGIFPADKTRWKYLLQGESGGVQYHYRAALRADYRANPSPFSRRFEPLQVERITPKPGEWGLRWWIAELSRSQTRYPRYISDGNLQTVAFPSALAQDADPRRILAAGSRPLPYTAAAR